MQYEKKRGPTHFVKRGRGKKNISKITTLNCNLHFSKKRIFVKEAFLPSGEYPPLLKKKKESTYASLLKGGASPGQKRLDIAPAKKESKGHSLGERKDVRLRFVFRRRGGGSNLFEREGQGRLESLQGYVSERPREGGETCLDWGEKLLGRRKGTVPQVSPPEENRFHKEKERGPYFEEK